MSLSATTWRKKRGARAHRVVPRFGGGASWLGTIADQKCLWRTRDGHSGKDDVCALRGFASNLQDVQAEIRDPPAR